MIIHFNSAKDVKSVEVTNHPVTPDVVINHIGGRIVLEHKDRPFIYLTAEETHRAFTNIDPVMTCLAIRRFIENPHLDSR